MFLNIGTTMVILGLVGSCIGYFLHLGLPEIRSIMTFIGFSLMVGIFSLIPLATHFIIKIWS
jgi:hypothetical protein